MISIKMVIPVKTVSFFACEGVKANLFLYGRYPDASRANIIVIIRGHNTSHEEEEARSDVSNA